MNRIKKIIESDGLTDSEFYVVEELKRKIKWKTQ